MNGRTDRVIEIKIGDDKEEVCSLILKQKHIEEMNKEKESEGRKEYNIRRKEGRKEARKQASKEERKQAIKQARRGGRKEDRKQKEGNKGGKKKGVKEKE